MSLILVVCTANICRSPMAACLLRRRLKLVPQDVRPAVISAGTWAKAGQRAADGAIRAMRLRGLELEEHRSKIVTEELILVADLVIVMEEWHQEALRAEFPSVAERVFTLTELAGRSGDVDDPYGGSDRDYDICATEMDWLLGAAMDQIIDQINSRKDPHWRIRYSPKDTS
jgi:protein-tyrosine-phosphatase